MEALDFALGLGVPWRSVLLPDTEANPSTALEVIIAAQKPYGPYLNGWAVALAIAGWLMIPVLIGTGASLVAEATIRRIRATQQEAIDELRTDVAELHRRVG